MVGRYCIAAGLALFYIPLKWRKYTPPPSRLDLEQDPLSPALAVEDGDKIIREGASIAEIFIFVMLSSPYVRRSSSYCYRQW